MQNPRNFTTPIKRIRMSNSVINFTNFAKTTIFSILQLKFANKFSYFDIRKQSDWCCDFENNVSNDEYVNLKIVFQSTNRKVEIKRKIKMEVKRKPFVVSVEGNIGSGKSTMLQYYSELDDVQLHPEPVEKWQNLNGHNLLEKLYSDPKRWSFQVWTFRVFFKWRHTHTRLCDETFFLSYFFSTRPVVTKSLPSNDMTSFMLNQLGESVTSFMNYHNVRCG